MLRYALYARKSHDKREVTEKSTGEQVQEGELLAGREDLHIAWKAEESKSAMIPNVRPLYAEMIRQIKVGRIDGIICWHVNRLIRNMEEGGMLVQLLVDGKLREIRTPHACYRTKDSILPIVIEAASAAQQSIDQKHTVKRSMNGNFRNGGWNHKTPPGYQNVRDERNSKRGKVIPDRKAYGIIEKAWHLMLTETATEAHICRLLKNEWGYRFRESLVRPSRPMSYNAVRDMFRNPFYAGYVRENGEILQGRHKAMISVAQFQQVQRILESRGFSAKRKHRHAFTGFLLCAYCGQRITAENKKISTGSIWEVYRCSDSYQRCTKRGMSLAKVDEALSSIIQSVRVRAEYLKVAADDLKRSLQIRQDAFALRVEQQRQTVQTTTDKLNRLTNMWVSGLLTDADRFSSLQSELLREKEAAVLALGGISSDYHSMLKKVDRVMEVMIGIEHNAPLGASTRKRDIAKTLGTFHFYGREKKIELQLRPILREFLAFTDQFSPSFEPPESGSGTQKRAASSKPLYFGRREAKRIELPDTLIEALLKDDLPPVEEIGFEGFGTRGS